MILSSIDPVPDRHKQKTVPDSRPASDGVLGAQVVIGPPVEVELEHPVVSPQGTPGKIIFLVKCGWFTSGDQL